MGEGGGRSSTGPRGCLRCYVTSSGQLTKCCSDLVVDLMQERRDKGNNGGGGGRSSTGPRVCLRCYVASPVS